jgi:hypothetical protein
MVNEFFEESLDMLAYGLAHMRENGSTNKELRDICTSYIIAVNKFINECLGDDECQDT